MSYNQKAGTYYAELNPDARGFTTFLEVRVVDGEIVSARLDGKNEAKNPYGTYKTMSEKYNHDMHAESGTYYRDAAKQLEDDILSGKQPLRRVEGARVLSHDANILLDKVKKQANIK